MVITFTKLQTQKNEKASGHESSRRSYHELPCGNQTWQCTGQKTLDTMGESSAVIRQNVDINEIDGTGNLSCKPGG